MSCVRAPAKVARFTKPPKARVNNRAGFLIGVKGISPVVSRGLVYSEGGLRKEGESTGDLHQRAPLCCKHCKHDQGTLLPAPGAVIRVKNALLFSPGPAAWGNVAQPKTWRIGEWRMLAPAPSRSNIFHAPHTRPSIECPDSTPARQRRRSNAVPESWAAYKALNNKESCIFFPGTHRIWVRILPGMSSDARL